jgi:alpha-tubulin suppressor-like RCC1 family protein
VSDLGAVAEVAVGDGHACARLADGSVACWGANESGQLGDGTTLDRHLPTFVIGLP